MRALVLLLTLAACAQDPARALPGDVTCDASNWQDLIGQPEEALYGALANLRVIRPGQPVSRDYNPNRLNAVIGADGTIHKFACY